MKKLMMILFMVGAVFAQDSETSDLAPIPLAEFGPGGYFEANFMGEALPEHFYNSFPSKSATNGLNYTGLVTGMNVEKEGSRGEMLLALSTEDNPANVVISLTSNTTRMVRNFVVTMVEWDSRLINLSGYSFDNMHLIVGEPVVATLTRPGQRSASNIELVAPRVQESLPACDFCQEDTQKHKMQGLNPSYSSPMWDNNAGYWFVYIKRYENNPSNGYWRIDVEYPNQGDTFHAGTGSSTYQNPACKIYTASTDRVGGSKSHHWKHAGSGDLDDVLWDHKDVGYAYCTSGCSGTEEFVFKRYVATSCQP